jgi:hypothetical protein
MPKCAEFSPANWLESGSIRQRKRVAEGGQAGAPEWPIDADPTFINQDHAIRFPHQRQHARARLVKFRCRNRLRAIRWLLCSCHGVLPAAGASSAGLPRGSLVLTCHPSCRRRRLREFLYLWSAKTPPCRRSKKLSSSRDAALIA